MASTQFARVTRRFAHGTRKFARVPHRLAHAALGGIVEILSVATSGHDGAGRLEGRDAARPCISYSLSISGPACLADADSG